MMKRFILFLVSCILSSVSCISFAEDVKITTYYPSPYATYKELQVQNGDEDTDITKFTHELTQAGLSIITDYTDTAYTPGIFWSTQDANADKPKAGIWMYEADAGTKLLFGTSSDYLIGLNNTPGLVLNQSGNVGIGIESPQTVLDVNSDGGTIRVPRKSTTGNPASGSEGMLYYNDADDSFRVYQGAAGWTDTAGTDPPGPCNSWIIPNVNATRYILSLRMGGKNVCADGDGCIIRVWPDNTDYSPMIIFFWQDSVTNKWQGFYFKCFTDASYVQVNTISAATLGAPTNGDSTTTNFTGATDNSSSPKTLGTFYDDVWSAPKEADSDKISYGTSNVVQDKGVTISICDY